MSTQGFSLTATPNQALYEEQIKLEEDMVSAGRDRFYRAIDQAKLRGEESGTGYGSRLLKTLIAPMAEAIGEFVASAQTGKAGRRHSALKYISLLDPEVVAYLTLKRCLDCITRQQRLQKTALDVASAIQDEVWMLKFKAANEDRFKATLRHISASTSRRHSQTVARIMASRAGVVETWPLSDKIHLGTKLIEMLRDRTGLVDIVRRSVGVNDTPVFVVATEATMAWINNANERMDILAPTFLPTIIPPKPWSNPFNGGYHSGLVRRMPMVKGVNRNYLEELSNLDLSQVYASVNAMQDTAWRINAPLLAVLREAWDGDMKVGKLPARDRIEMPEKPADIATNDDAKRDWKRRAAKIHEMNAKLKSKRLQLRKIVEIAEQFVDRAAVYFPHQLDFRGRCYAVPMFLNPQGPDFSKALLTFAQGKAIGDGDGPRWLAIHGANTFGYDKASLDERVEWAEERSDIILAAAADPFGDARSFWAGADKPWQFLAFCLEWAGFKAQGAAFVSSLPIALDGSCNGLQHYSAALRDPIGGAAVNLLPADKPQDIYARVAEVVLEMVQGLVCPKGPTSGTIEGLEKLEKSWAKHGLDPIDMAHRWLAFGLDRKVTKRSVMTLPYGSTTYSCREFLEEAMRDKIADGKANTFATPETDGIFAASMWLTPLVWQAIGQVVKAARVGMDWLKQCAKLAAGEGLPVSWETPDGFLVQQVYHESKSRRLETVLDGKVLKLTLAEDLPTMDTRKQATGVAPNWVHSMDATAMRMFVNIATQHGVTDFALIHDSYGTKAADVGIMGACLRKAFVLLYTERDPLAEFRVDIAAMLSDEALGQLPALPPKGDLDISLVEQSDFFFA